LIQIAPASRSADAARKIADVAALGVLVRIGGGKRLLVRSIEAVLRPFVWLVDRLSPSVSGPMQAEVQRILVVEYWNLGDIIMELPFLQNLRIQYPRAQITLLTSPKCVPLIADQGLVDEMIVVRVPWAQHYSRWRKYNPFSFFWIEFLRTLTTLRAKKFDLAFTARADIRENFILWLVNVRRRVGYAFGGGGFLLTDTATPDLARPHFSCRWLRLLEHLGKPILSRKPHLRINPEEQAWAEQYLAERGVKADEFIIALHPGARSAIRQWGEENFIAVAERLWAKFSVKILWFQDPGQLSSAPKPRQWIPLSLPLRQFMAVLNRCSLFICNDSGPMHIATALDVPVVGIFGPTQPTWFGPLGDGHHVVIRPEFWCRPCFDYCIFDQPYCLRLVTVESVYEAAAEALRAIFSAAEVSKAPSAVVPASMNTISRVEQEAD
jgi:lipopolysaccharide heptosyltransferase II